eukprot:CAMPEP_0170429360 /NCGR_PEP_ID=MMETSP0117_2-20130122/40267_1 /TAXON_ID=400756 /ORGANISM="Durinskia baltica, Strain CSIRO CS-38" /LENGTH=146 /DNA_ID=CAMNT_0010688725 /DNA_START=30 /DNA_END=466 /DNA_ORIENTATION=-
MSEYAAPVRSHAAATPRCFVAISVAAAAVAAATAASISSARARKRPAEALVHARCKDSRVARSPGPNWCALASGCGPGTALGVAMAAAAKELERLPELMQLGPKSGQVVGGYDVESLDAQLPLDQGDDPLMLPRKPLLPLMDAFHR